jgi:hypothetical protein
MNKLTILLALISLCVNAANAVEPHISYVYPAGGRGGEAVDIIIAGQNLRAPEAAYISDKSAKPFIIEYIPPLRPLRDEDRTMFRKRLAAIQKELRQNGNEPLSDEEAEKLREQLEPYPQDSKLNHPLLREMENLNAVELRQVAARAFGGNRPDPQMAESISVKLNIRKNIKPGTYQIRLLTAGGLSNPLNFQIDKLPELCEREPNDKQSYLEPANVPVIFNGQIMPGDIDRLSFIGRKGEKLVIEAHARNLKPYMADAVPGWFQAVMSVLDEDGNELAYCDDYVFNPDPVIFFEVPRDGTYQVQIYDSIYRGREDFVYRISVGERPFIKSVFPLGTQADKSIEAAIDGWNLPVEKATLNMQGSGRNRIKHIQVNNLELFSNAVPYIVEAIDDCFEDGASSRKLPQFVTLPIIINGRIDKPSQSDYFSFEGKKDQRIVLEVNARSLNSPLDAAIELSDHSGKIIAFVDDHTDRTLGLQTHHSDPYLMTTLPADGAYMVRIFDVTAASGREYAYRLRISEPAPTYELRITPSSIALPPGQTAAVKIDVLSKDGFDEEILLGLRSSPKAGYRLRGGRIPPGKQSIYVTITAPANLKNPSELIIESRARTKTGIISKTAVPAENMMQAFIYYQLVPSQEMIAAGQNVKWKMPTFKTDTEDIKLRAGQRTKLKFTNINPGNLTNKEITARLLTQGDMIRILDIQGLKNAVEMTIEVDRNCPVGYMDNIVAALEMHTERVLKSGEKKKQTVELNSLPAVSIEIIETDNKDSNDKLL